MLAVQVSYYDLLEKRRHNLEQEKLANLELQETSRHNVQNEVQARNQLEETMRANRANERLTGRSIQESQRHNVSVENENRRHNFATENLSAAQIDVSRQNIGLGFANLSENARHNLATEEVSRQNAASQWISSMASRTNAQASKQNANTNAAKQALDYQKYMETSWQQGAIPNQSDEDRTWLGALYGVSKVINEIIPF